MTYRGLLKAAFPLALLCLLASAAPVAAQPVELLPVGDAPIALAADPDGGYVLAWADPQSQRVRFVLVNEDGLRSVVMDTDFVGSPAGVRELSLAVGAGGSWAVVAESPEGSVTGAIVSPDGDLVAALDLAVPGATSYRRPVAAAVPSGGFVVAWGASLPDDFEPDGPAVIPINDVWAARFDAGGDRVAGPVRVNQDRPSDQYPADLVVRAGRVLVAWDTQPGESFLGEVRARLLGLDLTPLSDEIELNPESSRIFFQRDVRVGMGADGRFLATWTSGEGELDGSERGASPEAVRARPFSATGQPLSGEQTVNVHTAGLQEEADLGVTAGGVAWIVWEDHGVLPFQGERPRLPRLVARPFTVGGTPLGGERLVAEDVFPRGRLQVVAGSNSALSAWVAADTLFYAVVGETADLPPIAPPEEFALTSLELPGFRAWVRITAGDSSIWGVMEPLCIPETLCASGALPGRTEVLVRVVGPKPNGFLWPTLVKLTTSRVEVWLEQTSTGEVQHYVLPGASPGNDVLNGLFDRDGFRP
jgi:hypothetical protein